MIAFDRLRLASHDSNDHVFIEPLPSLLLRTLTQRNIETSGQKKMIERKLWDRIRLADHRSQCCAAAPQMNALEMLYLTRNHWQETKVNEK